MSAVVVWVGLGGQSRLLGHARKQERLLPEQGRELHRFCCEWFGESRLCPSSATHVLSDLGNSPYLENEAPESRGCGLNRAHLAPY